MFYGLKIPGFWDVFFSWEGRLNRKPFLLIILITDIFIFIPAAFVAGIYAESFQQQLFIWHILDCVILLITCCPTIKRLHDFGYSGGWYFLFVSLFILSLFSTHLVLTLIWMVLIFSILVLPGTKGPNAYGPDPLETK